MHFILIHHIWTNEPKKCTFKLNFLDVLLEKCNENMLKTPFSSVEL